jgi:hypothetical protein
MPDRFDPNDAYRRCRDFVKKWVACGTDYVKRELRRRRAESANDTPQDRAARATATATWIIALFAIVTAIAAIRTYGAINGQLAVMSRQLKDAEDARGFTEEQLGASLGLVGITPGAGIDSETGKPTQSFIVQIQNMGGTRTAWARGWASIQYFPGKVPSDLDFSKPHGDVRLNTVVVAPNGFLPLSAVGIPVEQANDAIAGKGTILVWGRGEYATIYEPERGIPIRFCVLMNPLKLPFAAANVPGPPPNGGGPIATLHAPQQSAAAIYLPELYRPDCN